MKTLQKFIASIVIISLILSLGLNLVIFKTKQVKAQGFPVGDTTVETGTVWDNLIKEFGLDSIGRFVARLAMNRLRASLIRWAQGGFRDDNQPLSITNWRGFFQEAINLGSAKFIQEFNLTPLCLPFQYSIGVRLGLAGHPYDTLPYQEYAACTIGTIVDNMEEFFENPSITIYGWDTWTALTQPQNNIYGSFLLAAAERTRLENEEKAAAQAEGQAGQGYRNENDCIKDLLESCRDGCTNQNLQGSAMLACIVNCEMNTPPGICIEYRTKNIGSTTYAAIEKTVGSDIDWLISAHEWSDLVEIMISALLNKVMFGLGIAGGSYRPTTQQQYREQYAYHQITKKMLTPQQQYQARSKTLSRVLGEIKSMNRTMRSCDKNEVMTIDQLVRAYDEVLEGESQAVYSEMERIDLQPDYEVLDPINAPPNLVVYGYSWQNIVSEKYPQKCRDILKESNLPFGSTCSNIKSGLPPVSQNPQCECIFDHNHHNCPPAPYPTIPFDQIRNVWTLALDQAKASFYNSCMGTYDDVTNRCNECLKKAEQECEQMTETDERTNCINQVCNNYGTIAGVVDAQDFYNKCLIEERKTSCYTCLKEYFMPADYCSLTGDYIARAAVKYPGIYRKSRSFAGIDWLASDTVAWIGVREPSQCPDSAYDSAETSVDLVCRIEPDFTLSGTRICRTYCPITADFTEEQLYDINDDKPNDRDCNYQLTRTGGMPGIWAVENGAFQNKGKCCRVFKAHKPNDYAACGGQAAQGQTTPPSGPCTYAKPMDQEPWCYCGESERPIANAKNTTPFFNCKNGICPAPCNTETNCGNTCGSNSFEVPNMNRLKDAYFISNAAPGGSVMFIAKDTCSDPDSSTCRFQQSAGIIINNSFSGNIFNSKSLAQASACDCDTINGGVAGWYDPPLWGGCDWCCPTPPCSNCGQALAYCDGCNFDYSDWTTHIDMSYTGPGPGVKCPTASTGACDCDTVSGGVAGWYDPPGWGGCGTCPGASQTPPKGCVALSYCDGCNFDYDWNNMKCVDAPTGPCDYVANGPSQVVCQKETYNSSSSKRCCSQCGGGLIGTIDMTCDLTGYIGQTLNIGSYNNQESDCVTGVLLCVPCDPSDPEYPYYGTQYDQCNGKL